MDTVIPNGQPAPDFHLHALDGRLYQLSRYRGSVVILNFWSANCPHAARTDQEIRAYLQDWKVRVTLLPVAANANEEPDLLRRVAGERGLSPVLHDPHQQVADLYGAATTPHLFVIDPDGLLRYQGAFDDVTFRQRVPTRHYLREAVEAGFERASP